jgi:TonB-dependent receptor
MKLLMRAPLGALWSVSSLALASVLAAPAHAQDVIEVESDDGAVIVVTGQRLANRTAVDAKRDAAVISDVLASDDLNKLPDQNLAEALARVPGLTAFQDEGAGLYVGIRGLNQEFVNVTVDGLEASSAARTFDTNLRGANMEAVPSTFVAKVEVIKALTPDYDGDAIAGTVNLVTRSALDAKKPWLSLGGALGQYEEDVPPNDIGRSFKGNLSFGQTFAGERIGLVIDANVRDVERDNLKPNAWFGARGDGTVLPDEVGGFFYQRQEKSQGATAKLEVRPNDAFQADIAVTYFDSEIGIDKNKHAIFGATSNATAGTFTGAQGTGRNDRVEYGVNDSVTVTAGGQWFINDRHSVSARGSTSSSSSYQDDPRVDWFYGGPLSGAYEYNGEYYTYQFDTASQANWGNPARYVFNGYRRFQEELEKGVDSIRVDWTIAPSTGSGLGYKFGAKRKETNVDYTASNFRWDRPNGTTDFAQFLFFENYQFPGTNNPTILLSDIEGLSAYAEGLGTSRFSRIRSVIVNGNDYDVAETVLAGYGLIDWSGERFRFVGGLRYEDTQTEAHNRFNRADNAAFVTTSGGYGDWLPSAALTYFLTDRVLLRAGASRAIGRPDIRDLARGETPPNDNGFYSRGNPDLKPRISNNYDLSLEYYFDGGDSLLSAALFQKDIQDEIFDLQTPYVFTNALDVDVNSFFSQPDNGGSAKISGIELGLVKDRLDFLPGALANIGFSANVTLTQGELELLNADRSVVRTVNPEGLSERLANATLYYQGERLSARAAWRFVGEQTQALSIDGSADLQIDDYEQTDLQFGYKLADDVELFSEVWNAFENEQSFTNQNFVAGVPNWFENVRYGRAIWIGVNLKR